MLSLFVYEMVFEWAVPEDYVTHKISLQTLMERVLRWNVQYGLQIQLPPTAELRERIATDFQPCAPWENWHDPKLFRAKFGARAPLDWMANQLLYDCVKSRCFVEDIVKLNFANGHSEIVDWEFFRALDDGIEIALIDWFLLALDFLQEFEEFE